MPTARLIDINYLYERSRDRAVMCLAGGNYSGAIDGIYAMNNCLPRFGIGTKPGSDEKVKVAYRIVISDAKYQELTQVQHKITCGHCDATQDYDPKHVSRRLLPTLAQIASGGNTYRAWRCPLCKEYTAMSAADVVARRRAEDKVLGVAPSPPRMSMGIVDHSTYHIKMTQWVGTMLAELADAASRYRDDNWERGGTAENTDMVRLGTEGDV